MCSSDLSSFAIVHYLIAGGVGNLFFRYLIPMVPLLCLTAAIALPSARSVWRFDRLISQTDNRVVIARWFAEDVPEGRWRWDGPSQVFKIDRQSAGGRPHWIRFVAYTPGPNASE